VKSVLVTGGTVRIGAAVADYMRGLGWRVLVSSHREVAGADITADFSDPSGAVRCYSEAMRILGGRPPDVIVNNAALFTGDPAALEAVNFTAPVKLTILMAGREGVGRGAVVNILDSRVLGPARAGSRAADEADPYRRTKMSLLEYTFSAAAMFADALRVNAVAPGPVLAPLGVHEFAGEMPLGRPSAEDVAKAVAFLSEAQSTTGCVIPVDGGQSASWS